MINYNMYTLKFYRQEGTWLFLIHTFLYHAEVTYIMMCIIMYIIVLPSETRTKFFQGENGLQTHFENWFLNSENLTKSYKT